MSKKNRLKKSKQTQAKPPTYSGPSPGLGQTPSPYLILGLLAIAFCIASYLGVIGLQSGSVAGCGPESGCGDVLSSRWSSWFGVPVSLLALPLYVFLALTVCLLGNKIYRSGPFVLAALASSLTIGLAALWFTAIQALVIGKFCPWCLTAHGAGLWASLLVMKRCWLDRDGNAWARLLSSKANGGAFGFALIGLAILAGGQLVYEPETYELVTLSPGPESKEQAIKPSPSSEVKRPPVEYLRLHGGRFRLEAAEHPLIGDVKAGNYILSLFDYTCHHCRDTHPHLTSLVDAFPDDLAIISLPTPLNSDCNPLMQRLGRTTPAAHRDACNYAALSLAVYRLKPESWGEFDHWLFTGKNAPPVAAALNRAAGIVGDLGLLRQTMQESWIADEVSLAVEIYDANAQAKGQTRMPQIVIGRSMIAGAVNNNQRLFLELEKQFGLQRSAATSE